MTDNIRTRLGELEDRLSKQVLAGRFVMVHLFASRYGWKTSCSVPEVQRRAPDEYFPTATAALDFMDRAISAYEDRDGNLARTLGVEAA